MKMCLCTEEVFTGRKKCLLNEKVPTKSRHDKTGGLGLVRFGSSQLGCGSNELRVKNGHFKWVKKEVQVNQVVG